MPVKNAEPWLKECIDSILSQTETNWELIAVDDHSTDNSFEILSEYAVTEKRISVLKNEGTGIIKALRTAYAKSNGLLVTRMDADDKMATAKLATLKRNLLNSGSGSIAVGQVKYFSDEGLKDGYRYYETWLNQLTSKGTNYSDIYRECVIPSPCWMVFREDLDQCGAFEPDTYPEDYDLCFRYYHKGINPIPCNEVLHHWRDHSTRTSRNDPNYADNRFLDLKLKWFLEIDHNRTKLLVVWGASSKGKALARGLKESNTEFNWVCNNPNKIGKVIYGKEIGNSNNAGVLQNAQIIVAVANKDEQQEIRKQTLEADLYFFC